MMTRIWPTAQQVSPVRPGCVLFRFDEALTDPTNFWGVKRRKGQSRHRLCTVVKNLSFLLSPNIAFRSVRNFNFNSHCPIATAAVGLVGSCGTVSGYIYTFVKKHRNQLIIASFRLHSDEVSATLWWQMWHWRLKPDMKDGIGRL